MPNLLMRITSDMCFMIGAFCSILLLTFFMIEKVKKRSNVFPMWLASTTAIIGVLSIGIGIFVSDIEKNHPHQSDNISAPNEASQHQAAMTDPPDPKTTPRSATRRKP